MVTINAVVIKILNFLEVSVRKIRGSENEGIVELHVFFFLPQGNSFPKICLKRLIFKKHRCKH